MKSAIDRLIGISSDLRKRCPWDRKQTLSSLSPFILEESYELADDLSSGSAEKVKEELGDLLYLIMLCCQICREQHGFDIEEVANGIARKMVARHPAVFSGDKKYADTASHATWYRVKREAVNDGGRFSGIPTALPALLKAEKVQHEASALGFDWEDAAGVLEKIEEELGELKHALAGDGDVGHELGDLLFSIVNLSRFLRTNAELALGAAVRRFCTRFCLMENELGRRGTTVEKASLEEMDAVWDRIKQRTDDREQRTES